jgi:hypothetical protein
LQDDDDDDSSTSSEDDSDATSDDERPGPSRVEWNGTSSPKSITMETESDGSRYVLHSHAIVYSDLQCRIKCGVCEGYLSDS